MPGIALEVVVIGAGLGGLAAGIALVKAGHHVLILEKAKTLAEVVGAGIQVPPNATRILTQWRLLDQLEGVAERPDSFKFRSYSSGESLATVGLLACSTEKYGVPYLHVHRTDYHRILAEELIRLGGIIELNAEVIGLDPKKPAVSILGREEPLSPDLVIGADGVRSLCREALLGRASPPCLTGDVAYRCVIETANIPRRLGLEDLTESHDLNFWMGPDQHVVCYRLREGTLFNMVIARRENDATESRAISKLASVSVDQVRERLRGWDWRLDRLLDHADVAFRSQLTQVNELDSWVHPAGKFALLGDACHASLPYLAQGAALAIEDGAVLGRLFSKIQQKVQIGDILRIYEALRKSRTALAVQRAASGGSAVHLPDGALQVIRDEKLRHKGRFPGFFNPWTDEMAQDIFFGYDVEEEVNRAWDAYLAGRTVTMPHVPSLKSSSLGCSLQGKVVA